MAPTCASVTCDGLPAPARPSSDGEVLRVTDLRFSDLRWYDENGVWVDAPGITLYNVRNSGTLCSLRMFRDIPGQLALGTAPTPTLLLLALAALTHSEAHLAPAAPTGPWPLR